MSTNRFVLLGVSGLVVLAILSGGFLVGVGAADESFRQAVLFSEIFSLVVENYVDPVNQESLIRGALNGMMSGLDAQGAYLTPEEVARWKSARSTGDADPGLSLVKAYGALVIVAVAPGSPADAAGLGSGDQIRRIDGKVLRDLSMEQALRLLRGEPGTSVRLSILHTREGFKREEVTVKRARRSDPPYALESRGGVEVLKVRDLSRIGAESLGTELRQASGHGTEKLLVDVRNVTDGSPRDAARLLGLFTAGDLLVLKDRSGRKLDSLAAPGKGDAWPGPIAVLVNGGTAWGAEAAAKVLQTRRGAIVYGESTYGLGAEPKLFELPDGSGLLMSSQLWETASGQGWNGDGVAPDRPLHPNGAADDTDEEILRRAVEDFVASVPAEAARKAA